MKEEIGSFGDTGKSSWNLKEGKKSDRSETPSWSMKEEIGPFEDTGYPARNRTVGGHPTGA